MDPQRSVSARGVIFGLVITWNERALLRRAIRALVAAEGDSELAQSVDGMLAKPTLVRDMKELVDDHQVESARHGV
jgi:hypothetical protein